MQYMLMFYESTEDFAARTGPKADEYKAGWSAYIQALYKTGMVKNGHGLQGPDTATTIRMRGGRKVQDGPFADSKEQLGGYFVLEAPNLDAALEWAGRAPCAGAEVRPVLSM